MKYLKLAFLFFILIFTFQIQSCKKNVTNSFNTTTTIDSINNYYDVSKNNSLKVKEKIVYINSAISLAIKNDVDSLILKSISYKTAIYGNHKLLDSAINTSIHLLKKAKEYSSYPYQAKANYKLGRYHYKKHLYLDAYKYYNSSYELYKKLNDSINIAKQLEGLASIQKKFGDYYGSENNAVEALKYLNKNISPSTISSIYNLLGITSKEQKEYDEAIKWYNKAITLTKDSLSIIKYINNKAVVFIKQGSYKKAITQLHSIKYSSVIKKDTSTYAKVIDNIAYCKSKLNDLNAEKELQEALKLRKKIKDFSGQFASYIHLTEHNQDLKQNEIALHYAKRAYQIAQKINSPTSKLEALSYFIQLEDYRTEIVQEFQSLTSSINDSKQRNEYKFAKVKYDVEDTRKSNLLLKAQNAKSANQKLVLAILILVVSGIGFFINRYRKHQSKIALINERHTTEKRISKKIHDEVGNDIFYLTTRLQQDSDFTTNPDKLKILQGFDSVYLKVRDISRDYTVETGEEYGDELLSLLNSYGSPTTKVITNTLDTDFWSPVSAHKKGELYWILKELLTNMKKHSKASFVSVKFVKEKQQVVVTYVDNGIGINNKHLISKNGLRNVENRMKEIGGTITFESKPKQGFKAKLIFTS